MKIRRILLATDLSEAADRAWKQAVELAAQHRANEILETARSMKAQLIVMGTRGLSRPDYLLLGSVTERVNGHAKVPVFAIK